MAIPTVQIRREVSTPRKSASHVSNGLSVTPNLGILSKGYAAIFSGMSDVGNGIREVGKMVRGWSGALSKVKATNLNAASQTLAANGESVKQVEVVGEDGKVSFRNDLIDKSGNTIGEGVDDTFIINRAVNEYKMKKPASWLDYM